MSSENELVSVKELASKLKVTDALLKKIIKDFGIGTERVQKRLHLSDESVKTIREVLALRASGKKNNEIKEMFDAAQAEAKGAKAEKAPVKKKAAPKEKEEKAKTTTKKKKDSKETETKSEPKAKTTKKAKTEKATDSKKTKTTKKTSKKAETKDEESTEVDGEKAEKLLEFGMNATGINEIIQESEEETLDISSYLDESDEEEEEDIVTQLLNEEDDLEEEDEEIEEAEEKEGVEQKISPRKMRRRQFSFRYIQRQIANDSKRVNYIKQKLRRGRISEKDRLNLIDSLEHRSQLLNGWIHLLRWVKS